MDVLSAELKALKAENEALKKELSRYRSLVASQQAGTILASDSQDISILKQFHPILAQLPYFICVLDTGFFISYVNRVLPGFTHDSLLGRHLYVVIPEADQRQVEQAIQESTETKNTSQYVISQPDSEGNIHRILVTLQPLLDADGKIVRWMTIAHDISESFNAKSSLWHAQQRYHALVESSPLAIVEWAPSDHKILAWNPGAEKLFGYTHAESMSLKLTDFSLSQEADNHRTEILETVSESEALNLLPSIVPSRHKDGTSLFCYWTNVVIRDESNEVVSILSIGQDVTQSESSRRQLAEARDEAERLAEAKSAFIASVSHELRTPMHGIINAADLLDRELVDNEKALGLVELIGDSSHALLQLINDILDFSKAESGNLDLYPVPTDLVELIRSVCLLLEPQAQSKQIDLCVDSELRLLLIEVDALRIRQILYNLIGNAVKFTEIGSVNVRLDVLVENEVADICVHIFDTGIGIADYRLESIFDSFTQADNSITSKYGGTGLGLAISKKLSHLMGGDIQVESAEGKGSTFTLSLKAPISKKHLVKRDRFEVTKTYLGKVLVVDDNAINVSICTKQLQSFGLNVVSASNGLEAITVLEEQDDIDLVFMDLQMPVLDGFSATRRLRSKGGRFERLPIIAMTANQFEKAADYYEEIGLTDYMSKPFTLEMLDELLAKHAKGLSVSIE